MPNTITTTTLLEGTRNLVLLVNMVSDGVEGDETNTVLVDRSAFSSVDGSEFVVEKIEGLLSGFSAALSFDATADLVFVRLPDGDWFSHDWTEWGGVSSNKAGAGANGDILITTDGFDEATDSATFILHLRKN